MALFSPLASPGAPIYAKGMLRIFAETRRHQQPLSRDLAVSLLQTSVREGSAHTSLPEAHRQPDELYALSNQANVWGWWHCTLEQPAGQGS